MKLKLFFDVEYFQFIRDYVNLYTQSAAQGTTLYITKHDSESSTMSKLKALTHQYKNDPNPNLVTYKVAYKGSFIGKEDINIYEGDWRQSLVDNPGLNILKFAVSMAFDIVLKVKDVSGFV
jgi:hypothetical protein